MRGRSTGPLCSASRQPAVRARGAVVHLIMLVWKHSKHYNTPARLVVLMREICNDLIRQARNYVDAEQLFTMEPPEAVERLTVTLRVCGFFKSVYFDYKSRASTEAPARPLAAHCLIRIRFPQQHRHGQHHQHRLDCPRRHFCDEQVPNNPWRVQNTALFPRLDSFLERCHDLLDLCKTVVQFQKLEKVEIGGNKGRTLSASVYQIYSDFTSVLEGFKKLPYDVLDVETKQFDDDFYEFRCQIKELERRLGSVLNQGFEDCATVFAAFKLIESFEGLLEREFIQARRSRKHRTAPPAASSTTVIIRPPHTAFAPRPTPRAPRFVTGGPRAQARGADQGVW